MANDRLFNLARVYLTQLEMVRDRGFLLNDVENEILARSDREWDPDEPIPLELVQFLENYLANLQERAYQLARQSGSRQSILTPRDLIWREYQPGPGLHRERKSFYVCYFSTGAEEDEVISHDRFNELYKRIQDIYLASQRNRATTSQTTDAPLSQVDVCIIAEQNFWKTDLAIKELLDLPGIFFQIFNESELVFNITKCSSVDQHTGISEATIGKLSAQYNLTRGRNQFPKLVDTDPVARYYGLRPADRETGTIADVVEIRRIWSGPEILVKESVAYRTVISDIRSRSKINIGTWA